MPLKKPKPPPRPPQPKLGRGHIQLAAKRLFCIQDAITTAELVDWAYCARTEPLKSYHYKDCRRALTSIGAVRIGRAASTGRPWIWTLPIPEALPDDEQSQ